MTRLTYPHTKGRCWVDLLREKAPKALADRLLGTDQCGDLVHNTEDPTGRGIGSLHTVTSTPMGDFKITTCTRHHGLIHNLFNASTIYELPSSVSDWFYNLLGKPNASIAPEIHRSLTSRESDVGSEEQKSRRRIWDQDVAERNNNLFEKRVKTFEDQAVPMTETGEE